MKWIREWFAERKRRRNDKLVRLRLAKVRLIEAEKAMALGDTALAEGINTHGAAIRRLSAELDKLQAEGEWLESQLGAAKDADARSILLADLSVNTKSMAISASLLALAEANLRGINQKFAAVHAELEAAKATLAMEEA